jgi:hypothetical protein
VSITCPACQRTSHNPNDELHGYCGNCHAYTSLSIQPEWRVVSRREIPGGMEVRSIRDPLWNDWPNDQADIYVILEQGDPFE